jgi:lysophospholipase L1-like esterase
MRQPRLANVLLVLVATLFAVALAEVALRIALPQRYDVHPRGLYVADEAAGYALAPGFRGTFERPEFRHPVTIGPQGLRGERPLVRRPETFRIVCIGDSFTWGLGVADNEPYPQVLERQLAARFPGLDVQVVNAGVPGFGTADQLRFFESRAEWLDPDLLIVQVYTENDFLENRRPALGRVTVRDGWLRANEPPRPQPWRTLDALKRHSDLATFVSERAGYLAVRAGLLAGAVHPPLTEEDAELAHALLGGLAGIASRFDAPVTFIMATSQAAVIGEQEMDVPARAIVAHAAEAANAAFIDLTPLLRARPDRLALYHRHDGHWAAPGHAAVAEILAVHVESNHAQAILARAGDAGDASARPQLSPVRSDLRTAP